MRTKFVNIILLAGILLSLSFGSVFATTTNFYAGPGDGYVSNLGADWNTIRSAGTGTTANYTGEYSWVQSSQTGANYYIGRTFYPIDTSAIPDTATITSAVLHFTVYTVDSGNATATLESASQASSTILTTADYGSVGVTRLADDVAVNSTGAKSMTLNAAGLATISKTGYTLLSLREQNDFDGDAPGTGIINQSTIYTSEQTGTSSDPYLEVTYTVPTTRKIKGTGISR